MTMPEGTGRTVPVRNRRSAIRIVLLCLVVAAMLLLAATAWFSGR